MSDVTPQWRNLVFEGGGVKGIAAIGAVAELQSRGYLDGVVRVGGTSAGAINALIYALGYSVDEQRSILQSTDFEGFLDDSFGFIRDVRRLARHFGWHQGEFFRGWLGDLVEAKLGDREASFSDLQSLGLSGKAKRAKKLSSQPASDRPSDQLSPRPGADLYVIGTNLSTGFAEVFSAETHPQMSVLDAVRISMSIPLFFQAVRLGERGDVYVDGGVQLNYPIRLFDHSDYVLADEACVLKRKRGVRGDGHGGDFNCQTLGIRLDTQQEIALFRDGEPKPHRKIRRFGEYAKALVTSIMNQENKQHLDSEDWARTVYVDTLDVGTTDFGLSDEKKDSLVQQGVLGARRYLEWFEGAGVDVVHRV